MDANVERERILAVEAALVHQPNAMSGFICSELEGHTEGDHRKDRIDYQGHTAGISLYSSVWPLLAKPNKEISLGLPGTWIMPENNDAEQNLCPPGTGCPEDAANFFIGGFQSIEGSVGYWDKTTFSMAAPKYRMVGTANGYSTQITNALHRFDGDTARQCTLDPHQLSIAHLSNTLLVPPDGVTFDLPAASDMGDAPAPLFGIAHLALPLTKPHESHGVPVGEQCWTTFLTADNFRGPVMFWLPEAWTVLSRSHEYSRGRGLDAKQGLVQSLAMEINTVPGLQHSSDEGVFVCKVPTVQWVVDENGESVLAQGFKCYSKAALYDSVAAWRDGGEPASCDLEGTIEIPLNAGDLQFEHTVNGDAHPALGMGAEQIKLVMQMEDSVAVALFQEGGVLGLRWSDVHSKVISFPSHFVLGKPPTEAVAEAGGRVLGVFRCEPYENDWHEGVLTQSGDTLVWRNLAGVQWSLLPAAEDAITGPDCPYFEDCGEQQVALQRDAEGKLTAFIYDDCTYSLTDKIPPAVGQLEEEAQEGAESKLHGVDADHEAVPELLRNAEFKGEIAAREVPESWYQSNAYMEELALRVHKESGGALGPHAAELLDGSQAVYYWVKFAEQPTVAHHCQDWQQEEIDALQAMVEQIHAHWCAAGIDVMAPPCSSASLVSLDPGLVVNAPEGYQVGYVPLVVAQFDPRNEDAAFFVGAFANPDFEPIMIQPLPDDGAVFRYEPYENEWHEGTLTQAGDTFVWRNQAEAQWSLLPAGQDTAKQLLVHALVTGPDYEDGEQLPWNLQLDRNGDVASFIFHNSWGERMMYKRVN